ncbi:MAG: hypothetical protein JRN06_06050 [Nitrososphaerota archaeon]|nr:hypothetical protein [Nitrososphaerota archaeon]
MDDILLPVQRPVPRRLLQSGLGQASVLGLALSDLLFSFGYGLRVGRNIQVYSMYTSILKGKTTIPSESL